MDGFTSEILPAERKKTSFDVAKLDKKINQGRGEKYDKFLPLFSSDIFNQDGDDVLSYEDLFKKKISRVTEAFKIVRDNPTFMFAHMKQQVQMGDYFEHNGIFLHFTMMLNYIKSQGTPEQQSYWLGKAAEGDFIAAYAQTELGHGSNVRGLETTATLDVKTQEWEIHSPTLTSMKFWPTGMYACTHALVFANLIIGKKNYGFHGFMVQLRSADGNVMPGVELGEIGPKLNFTSNNIGYCRFNRVRVPLDRMFSKHSQVTKDGKYIAAPKKLSKFRYISMMLARVGIIGLAYRQCAMAATIAIRYSAVRAQGFKSDAANGEHVVLDYQMQRYRTFRALSFAYCLLWNARYIQNYLKRVQDAIQNGDDSAADDLPELHATLSGMKATATVRAHDCIEECRKCCGGQGFLLSSGIGKLSPDFSEWVTVEGEQVILSLQCARFLIKAVQESSAGKTLTTTVAYIGEKDHPVDISNPKGILDALHLRARHMSKRLTAQFEAHQKTGADFNQALNAVAVLAYRASTAHVEAFMLKNNYHAIETTFADDPSILRVMTRLLELQGLQMISEKSGEFVGAIDVDTIVAVDTRINTLLEEIRPDAVGLVDAFGFRDSQLQSTLGRYDGNVYEAIYDRIKRNPLNRNNDKMVGWDEYKTILDLDFLEETAKVQRHIQSSLL